MKALRFAGDSLERLREFPLQVRKVAGFELRKVQDGSVPTDFKTLVGLPSGVQELRLRDEQGTFRIVYVAKFADAIYVLHAFQKKTQATSKRDLDLIRSRYEGIQKSL